MMIAAMAMASYSASAELEPQWSKGTMMVNAAIGVQPFGGTVSLDYVLVDEWWKGHFTVGGEFDFSVPYKHETAIGITPRATYGLNITPEFEVHVDAPEGAAEPVYNDYSPDGTTITYDGDPGGAWRVVDADASHTSSNIDDLVAGEDWFPALRAGITYKF